MESRDSSTSSEAIAALRGVEEARSRLARRASSPWWYRVGAALCTAALFVGVGLVVGREDPSEAAERTSMLVVVIGAIVGPAMLLAALKRTTGISIDRYAQGLGAWYAVVFGLFGLAFALQQFGGVEHALVLAGVAAFVVTLITERRIDETVRARLHAGQGSA